MISHEGAYFMKHQLLNIVRFIFLFSFSVQSQTETVTATFKYILGDNDTRNDAKRIALLEAKKLCIEKVGTFVEGKISRQTNETIIMVNQLFLMSPNKKEALSLVL